MYKSYIEELFELAGIRTQKEQSNLNKCQDELYRIFKYSKEFGLKIKCIKVTQND